MYLLIFTSTVFPFFFFFNDTATTEIYTLSLHDALPICMTTELAALGFDVTPSHANFLWCRRADRPVKRSEEHTSELQSQSNLVCRLLLEKKKKKHNKINRHTLTPNLHAYMRLTISRPVA